MSSSAAAALRLTVMPRSIAIAQSFDASSLSLSTCGSLLSRVPLPLVRLMCSWLECVDLLRLFRTNRTLVALHHQPPRHLLFVSTSSSSSASSSSSSPSSSSSSSASQWSEWVASAWSHARLGMLATTDTLLVEPEVDFSHSRNRSKLVPLFPDVYECNQPAHLFRLVLAATPHLRHLRLHTDTREYGYMADMADTLDLLPALRTLVVSAEADDCTDASEEQLYIPLPEVLARHPRLHALQCEDCSKGALDLSPRDILAIASHPALAHIDVTGCLHIAYAHRKDYVQLDFGQSELEDMSQREGDETGSVEGEDGAAFSRRPCAGCTPSSAAARLALLRYVKERRIEDDEAGGECFRADACVDMDKLIVELDKGETVAE